MKRWIWIALALVLVAVGIFAGVRIGAPRVHYAKGVSLRAEQDWDQAIEAFAAAGDYSDAPEQIVETKYQKAEALRLAGEYEQAYAVYIQIADYKDVGTILATDAGFRAANEMYEEHTAPFKSLGNVVTFGRYEQDNDPANGKEDIEWIVLDQQADRALLVSKYGLDCKPFHATRSIVTWEKCSLRHWLNGAFLSEAFDPAERQAILKARIDNGREQGYVNYSASSGSDTQDQVFLLSYAEAWKYFPTNEARMTSSTAYAKAQGAYTSPVNENCWWWLRSSGNYGTCATNVHYDGSRGDYLVHDIFAAVRPAIWVDLHSEYFSLGEAEPAAGE